MTGVYKSRTQAGASLLVLTVLVVSLVMGWDMSADPLEDMRSTNEVTIVLTDEGFMPRSIAIAPGTTVTFTTAQKVPFWPASDMHPTHYIHPEFDPRAPVEPGGTWSYTFEKTGVWAYHNHLRAIDTGSILVVSPDDEISDVQKIFETCGFAQGHREQLACFNVRIHDALGTRGLDAAYDILMALYVQNPAFTESCHTFAHNIGLGAFQYYGDHVPLTSKVGYCNDGFFHGYMEGFFIEHSSDEARDFCDRVRLRFGAVYKHAGPQCDHGIGHGIAEFLLHEKPELWNNIPRLIDEALSVCAAQVDKENRDRCASGVYSVVGDWLNFRPEYADLFSKNDPYALCRKVTETWAQHGCVWEFSKRIRKFFPASAHSQDDFVRPMRLAIHAGGTIANGLHLENIVRSMAHTSSYPYVLEKPGFLISLCRDVSEKANLQEACVIGVMSGLFVGGRPENGPERASALCTSEALSESERSACSATLLEIARSSHEPEDLRIACKILVVANVSSLVTKNDCPVSL